MLEKPLCFRLLPATLLVTLMFTGARSYADGSADGLQDARKAASAGDSQRAVALLSEVIQADPKVAAAYYLRGRERFRLGEVDASLADFDRYVQLQPDVEPRQWERGISCYYAGKYKQGARQFELYQTFHANDVENSVWRYLCMARSDGVQKARAAMLPIRNDRRVPMMEIYRLFRGQLAPRDVMQAARAGEPAADALNQRLFYAHLYVGLFHEAAGNSEDARRHIEQAWKEHRIGHYMWDVARVHGERLGQDGGIE